MSGGLGLRVGLWFRAALPALALTALCTAAGAEVKVTVHKGDHLVQGTTAAGLVRSMNSNPVQGDHGSAYASIHPSYSLSIKTMERGGQCRADVDLRLSFSLILPKASNPGGMSSRTRSAWNSFVTYARNHEVHHQASYTNCAKSFESRAERMSGKQCMALQSDIRTAFGKMKRDCEAKQLDYDRGQRSVVAGMALFSMARSQRRR